MATASVGEGQVCLHPPASVSGVHGLSLLMRSLRIPNHFRTQLPLRLSGKGAPLSLFHLPLFALGLGVLD